MSAKGDRTSPEIGDKTEVASAKRVFRGVESDAVVDELELVRIERVVTRGSLSVVCTNPTVRTFRCALVISIGETGA